MKTLLMNDYIRGIDSTGFASVTNDGDIKIAKVPSHPFDLFDMASFKSACTGHSSKVFMGHNRAATRGKINKANTHPFEHGNIVGAHNGSLDFNEWRDLEDAIGMKFGTDSEAIIAGIDILGVKETIGMLRGAWSLVWYNKHENSLNFLRNAERPMYLAFSKEYNTILWTSAWEILSASMMMTDGHNAYADFAKENTKTEKGVTYLPTQIDVHYAYDLEELEKGGKKKPKPRAKVIEGKAKEVRPVYHNPFTPLEGDTDPNSNVIGLPGPVKKNTQPSTGSDKIHEHITQLFSTQPFASWIPIEKFNELNRHGCSWCGNNDYEWEDAGWVVIENGDYIICPECTRERHGNRVYTAKEPYLS